MVPMDQAGVSHQEETQAMELDAAARPMVTSVLHPTDLTPASEVAFVHALKIALAGQTKLHILHAGEQGASTDWGAFPSVRTTLANWQMLKPGTPREEVDKRAGIKVAKTELGGDPVAGMAAFLNAHFCDFMVLATHGREGLSRWLHGSVAEPMVRSGDMRALLIPEGAKGFVDSGNGSLSLKRILIPVDRAPRPEAASTAATELAKLLDVEPEVHLLHVGDRDSAPVVHNLPGGLSLRSGDVVEGILAAAKELEVDLIAMTTAGHQGLLDSLRGSTTERVVRRAPCPVLVVPVQ